MTDELNIHPIELTVHAKSITRSHKAQGTLIVTYDDKGIKLGVDANNFSELSQALILAIHYMVELTIEAGQIDNFPSD